MGETKNNVPWFLVPIVIILVILFVVSSGCLDLTSAYVSGGTLTDGWYENASLRNSGSKYLGLEKWASATYQIDGDYPATLTVTTMKTLILMDEQELQHETKELINSSIKEGIILNESSETTGERSLEKLHITMYMTYQGLDTSGEADETVKIIGEVWNCPTSGTSVICIGTAYITKSNDNTSLQNTSGWEKIVKDPVGTIGGYTGDDGLIYNVTCH